MADQLVKAMRKQLSANQVNRKLTTACSPRDVDKELEERRQIYERLFSNFVEEGYDRGELWNLCIPLCKVILKEKEKRGPLIVGLAGPIDSGKTTFASRMLLPVLREMLGEALIEMDQFFLPDEVLEVQGICHRRAPNAMDMQWLLQCLEDFKEGHRYITCPQLIQENGRLRRTNSIVVQASDLLLVEGTWVYCRHYGPEYKQLDECIDLKLFLDADTLRTLREWRIGEEMRRGLSRIEADKSWENVEAYVEEQRKCRGQAHIVIEKGPDRRTRYVCGSYFHDLVVGPRYENDVKEEEDLIKDALDRVYAGLMLDLDGCLKEIGRDSETAIPEYILVDLRSLLRNNVHVAIVTGRDEVDDVLLEKLTGLEDKQKRNLHLYLKEGSEYRNWGSGVVSIIKQIPPFSISEYSLIGNVVEKTNCEFTFECIKWKGNKVSIYLRDRSNLQVLTDAINRELQQNGQHHIRARNGGANVSIFHTDRHKGSSVRNFADRLGIGIEEIAKIGDQGQKDGNDYEILSSEGSFSVNDYCRRTPTVVTLDKGPMATHRLLNCLRFAPRVF